MGAHAREIRSPAFTADAPRTEEGAEDAEREVGGGGPCGWRVNRRRSASTFADDETLRAPPFEEVEIPLARLWGPRPKPWRPPVHNPAAKPVRRRTYGAPAACEAGYPRFVPLALAVDGVLFALQAPMEQLHDAAGAIEDVADDASAAATRFIRS